VLGKAPFFRLGRPGAFTGATRTNGPDYIGAKLSENARWPFRLRAEDFLALGSPGAPNTSWDRFCCIF